MAKINQAQRDYTKLLNERESQYPADSYWIKQQKDVLKEHVRDPSKTF